MWQSELRDWHGRVLVLESTSMARKYCSALDVLYSAWCAETDSVHAAERRGEWHVLPSCALAMRAMRAHRSQLVWFRYLFVLFSRYAYVNTLRALPR